MRILEDPVRDPGWRELLDRHPGASIFHSPGWLAALQRTYGYQPFVVTTSAAVPLENGLVACEVRGWLSRRFVSLPFSDHSSLLVSSSDESAELVAFLAERARAAGCRLLELRTREASEPFFGIAAHNFAFEAAGDYCLHTLDLRPEISEIFQRFHPSHMQRSLRRAEREGLTYESGRSDKLLSSFYRLLRMTRRRHGLPPQPVAWFRNLVSCLGDAVTIHVASKDGRPIASIFTLRFKETIYYKYGGSDAAYHHLGGMPALFWRVIQQAHADGFVELDLGRSDFDQPGLIAFKDHLGATQSRLTYYRYPARHHHTRPAGWIPRVARGVMSHLPNAALDVAGRVLYKHFG